MELLVDVLDLTSETNQWPGEWKPRGWSTFDAESFGAWWGRHIGQFPGLDPRVLEQWMYRHWTCSDYWGLPLGGVSSHLERWSTEAILTRVGSPRVADTNQNCLSDLEDFEYLSELAVHYEPMMSMVATGTWNTPLLLYSSSEGFVYRDLAFESWRHWLVEGHQRLRFLRAMAGSGNRPADVHDVLVLSNEPPGS